MAKFYEPQPETQALYDEKISVTGLDKYITITIVVDNKSKDIFKVIKATPILKYRTNDDILIVLNEVIFEQLTEPQRHIIVEESLAGISFNDETDKLTVNPPDVKAYSGVLSKFTFETWNTVRESVKSLYAVDKSGENE